MNEEKMPDSEQVPVSSSPSPRQDAVYNAACYILAHQDLYRRWYRRRLLRSVGGMLSFIFAALLVLAAVASVVCCFAVPGFLDGFFDFMRWMSANGLS